MEGRYTTDRSCWDHLVQTRILKVLSGPTLTTLFLIDEGREDSNTTLSGP